MAQLAANLEFELRPLDVEGDERKILLARPAAPMLLDLDRLERLRKGDPASSIDKAIVGWFDGSDEHVDLVVFDAQGADGARFWGFGPDLDDAERMEIGRELLRSQLPMYRSLAERGVSGLVGVGFGSFELAAFQRGTVRIVTDLTEEHEDAVSARAAELEVDLWLIEHAASWTGLALAEYLAGKAAAEIKTREEKRPEIEKLLGRLSRLTSEAD